MNMTREIKYEIKTEHIQALLEGKKLTIDIQGKPRITLIPDRYGVFITMDRFMEIRRKIALQTITQDPEKTLRDIFGDDLYEKVIKKIKT